MRRTEATIDVTYFECSMSAKVMIGKPISNTNIYIVNSHMSPVPIGVAGELLIGGDGVARGYLNREELLERSSLQIHLHLRRM